ncbi:MAG TPA: ATP-binding protein, partial [Ramlibacter sp.]|nr:ATP-binding protein [Ramlibacter sp.]
RKALAAVREQRPFALAFVDMRMSSGWTGTETIEQLWHIDPLLQVVICTAYSDHPWDEVITRLDVRDRLLVVKKPFDLIEVSQLARTLTAKWNATHQARQHVESLEHAVAELQESQSALRRSHDELEAVSRSLSHDVRAPLTAMSSFSHLLARELGSSAQGPALHYLSRIQANAAIAEALIEDLLLLDRVTRAPLRLQALDLGALASRVIDEFRRAEPQREVEISVQSHLWVRADPTLAHVALKQLLGNAWKFTTSSEHPAIEFGRQPQSEGEDVFYVKDNGMGFDMQYAHKLFTTFQRLHTDTDLAGNGVGLATVSRIMGRHGGRIWAESSPSGGTTFYFTLPGSDREPPTATRSTSSQAPAENQASPSR